MLASTLSITLTWLQEASTLLILRGNIILLVASLRADHQGGILHIQDTKVDTDYDVIVSISLVPQPACACDHIRLRHANSMQVAVYGCLARCNASQAHA